MSAQDRTGMEYDRDVVVLYGDPAWRNALAVQDSGWKQELTSEKNEDGSTLWTLKIIPIQGDQSFKLVDGNGSQRSGRPFFQFFPRNVSNAKIIEGEEFSPLVTENFILVSSKKNKLSTETPTVIRVLTE
jgi:zinc protease